MTHRNAELSRLNNDLTNIQTSANLAIVLLGRDLTIRRFSAQAEKQFQLQASDIGRPFLQVRHNLIFEERRQAEGSSTRSDLRLLESGRRQGDRQESAGNVPAAAQSANDLESFIIDVIARVSERQREVRDNEGRWYSLRVRPYLTLDNRVEGAVPFRSGLLARASPMLRPGSVQFGTVSHNLVDDNQTYDVKRKRAG